LHTASKEAGELLQEHLQEHLSHIVADSKEGVAEISTLESI